jgi:hypothetical protein
MRKNLAEPFRARLRIWIKKDGSVELAADSQSMVVFPVAPKTTLNAPGS